MKKLITLLAILFQFGSLSAKQPEFCGTLVLIHGFLLSAHNMVPLGKSLRPCLESVYFEYPSKRRYICEHGAALAKKLQCIACEKPGLPIFFVTHSIGALVLRSALNHPDCPEEAKIGRAVLLAPPNQGSTLARSFKRYAPIRFVMGEKTGKELMTYCPEDVSALGQFPSTMGVLVIAGTKGIHPIFGGCPNDGFVSVEETYLDTFHYHRMFRLSHGEFENDMRIRKVTKGFLLWGK